MNVEGMNTLLNGGALAILGYWILYGLPKTLSDVNNLHAALVRELMADHQDDRRSNEIMRNELTKAIDKLADSIQLVLQKVDIR